MGLLQFTVQKNQINPFKIVLFAFLIIGKLTYAQYPTVRERVTNLPNFDQKLIHYGYYVGFNSYDFKFIYEDNYYRENYPDIEVRSSTGFNVGLVGDIRINTFFNLRFEPGLLYSKRNLFYPEFTIFTKESDRERELESTYIHLPLLLKINAKRINNFRPFLTVGVSTDFNLASNNNNIDDNFNQVFRTVKQSYNYELGFGFDFYLIYFKFSPSIRGISSMQNELVPDNPSNGKSPWTGKISKMLSRGFIVNLTFE